MVKLQPFDTARHLDNPEVITHYLAEAFQTRDNKLILRAIQNVARANNMSKIARETGMSRTSLYWRENTSPEFTTVLKVLDRIGMRLRVEPIAKGAPRAWQHWARPRRRGDRVTLANVCSCSTRSIPMMHQCVRMPASLMTFAHFERHSRGSNAPPSPS